MLHCRTINFADMKNIGLYFFLTLLLTACKTPNIEIKERIADADSVAINYFKGDGTMDTVFKVVIIKDKRMLQQLETFISAATATPDLKCGYDGSLHFFKQNMVVQDVDFRMNDAKCRYFSFKQSGTIEATYLSGEAKQLLQKLQQ